MTDRRLRDNAARLVVTVLAAVACTPLASASPTPVGQGTATSLPTNTSTPVPSVRTPAPTEQAATPSPTGTQSEAFEFVRWAAGSKIVASEPGDETYDSQDWHTKSLAAVLDRTEIDGVEWIRVQYGTARSGDFPEVGWVPLEADVETAEGPVHIDRVYEYVEPDCPAEPTLADLGGMVPLQALHCYGSRTLTFTPVQAREDGGEGPIVQGTPEWLASGEAGVMAYWLPGQKQAGSLQVYVDPDSGTVVNEGTWIEISGNFDHEAARSCTRSSEEPAFNAASEEEAVFMCRARFVLSEARRLSEAEIPDREQPLIAPGPEPAASVPFSTRRLRSDVAARTLPSTVWTGSELLVWGGWEFDVRHSQSFNDGAAYELGTGRTTRIPAAPIEGRARALATWTGSELLVWGGNDVDERPLTDGAAYHPESNTWRPIAPSPIEWRWDGTSVWTGTEWWVAIGARDGATAVAVYNPSSDDWRSLPMIEDELADTPTLAWTGSEIYLWSVMGLFRTAPDGTDWTAEPGDIQLNDSMVWTGDLLVGTRSDVVSGGPLNQDYLSHPVGWDPLTRTVVELPNPPRNVYTPVLAAGHLAFIGSGLALDLANGRWLSLRFGREAQVALGMVNNVVVWVGDRLVVWGGEDNCFGPPADKNTVYELIPEWPTSSGTNSGAASIPVSSGTGPSPAQQRFAC